jgi:hypothetical protein
MSDLALFASTLWWCLAAAVGDLAVGVLTDRRRGR